MDERSTETFGDKNQRNLKPELRALGMLLSELSILSFNTFLDAAETGNADEATVIDSLERMGCLTDFQAERIRRNSAAELRFDDYILLSKLGEGGMGAVFKAKNIRLDRIEAIKTIRAAEGHSEALARRFEREAKVLAKLEHPAIVPIYKVGRFQNTDYLAMKYVTGETLKSRVERARAACEHISFPVACQWMLDAADALAHAHEHNVIHRDIKPSNIMRQEKGRVIVLDMGIARLADPDADQSGPSLTMQQRGLGTPEYMPPEQWADARSVVPASDLYALGCTFFYVLTGRTPFTGNRLLDLMKAHSQMPAPSLLDFRKDVPEALDAVIHRLLEKRPEDRFTSANELVESIRGFASSAIVGSPTAISETIGDEKSAASISLISPNQGTMSRPKVISKAPVEKKPPFAIALIVTSIALLCGIAFVGYKIITKTDVSDQKEKLAQNSNDKEQAKELAPTPEKKYLDESAKLLDDAVRNEGSHWKSKSELEAALISAGVATEAKTEQEIAALKEAIAKLVSVKSNASETPKVPNWIVKFQKENSQDWQSVEELAGEVRRLVGTNKTLTDASESQFKKTIEITTEQKKRRRLDHLLDRWVTNYRENNAVAWPDPIELFGMVETLLPQKRLESETQLESLTKSLNEASRQLLEPFGQVKFIDGDDWTRSAVANLKTMVGTNTIVKKSGFEVTAHFVDGANKPVTKIKTNEKVWIAVEANKESCFAISRVDNGDLLVLIVNTPRPAGNTYVLNDEFYFSAPGKKRFVIYATDTPLIETRLGPGDSAALAKAFPSPLAFQRVLRALENGTEISSVPAPSSITRAGRAVIELEVTE